MSSKRPLVLGLVLLVFMIGLLGYGTGLVQFLADYNEDMAAQLADRPLPVGYRLFYEDRFGSGPGKYRIDRLYEAPGLPADTCTDLDAYARGYFGNAEFGLDPGAEGGLQCTLKAKILPGWLGMISGKLSYEIWISVREIRSQPHRFFPGEPTSTYTRLLVRIDG